MLRACDAVANANPNDRDVSTLSVAETEAYLGGMHEPMRECKLDQIAAPDEPKQAYKKSLMRARILGLPPPPKPAELKKRHHPGSEPALLTDGKTPGKSGSRVQPERRAIGNG